MTPHTKAGRAPVYTPDLDRAPTENEKPWWRKPSEIVAVIVLAGMLLAALGYQRLSYASLDERLTRNEQRVETLGVQQAFTNYLLCDLRRGTNADDKARSQCDDIIAKWGQRP